MKLYTFTMLNFELLCARAGVCVPYGMRMIMTADSEGRWRAWLTFLTIISAKIWIKRTMAQPFANLLFFARPCAGCSANNETLYLENGYCRQRVVKKMGKTTAILVFFANKCSQRLLPRPTNGTDGVLIAENGSAANKWKWQRFIA